MFIKNVVIINGFSFSLIYVFVALGVILSIFVYWFEGKRDGFDMERLLDLFFMNILLWGIFVIFFKYFSTFYYKYTFEVFTKVVIISFFVIILSLVHFFSKKWGWSLYRLLDVYSYVFLIILSSVLLGFGVVDGGKVAYVALGFGILFLILHAVRGQVPSGIVFGVTIIFSLVISIFFLPFVEYLTFYMIMLAIVFVTLYHRYRLGFRLVINFKKRKNMRNLDPKFIDSQKTKLLDKKKYIEEELVKLDEEDPYLQPGRDTDNAEEMDEAILEDRAKVEADAKKSNLLEARDQIDRALERMKDGKYGICEVTGNVIDMARLKAYPEAVTTYGVAKNESATKL